MGVIIGGAGGGVAALAAIAAIVALLLKKKKPPIPTLQVSTPAAVTGVAMTTHRTSAPPTVQHSMAIAVQSPTRQRITFPNNAPLGIGLKERGNDVFLSSVDSLSPAAEVPIGSAVKEINGASCAGKSKDAIMVMIIDAKANGPIVATFEKPGGSSLGDKI